MSVKIDVKLDVQSMGDFMIHQIFTSVAGITAIVLGIFNIALSYAFLKRQEYIQMVVFILFAILILWVFPWFVRYRVRKMKDSRQMTETVTYEFSEDGITTITSKDSGKASWKRFKKAVSKKQIVILYADKKQAIILPVSQMGENYTAIVDMIYEHMPAPAVRIRRLDGKRPHGDTSGQQDKGENKARNEAGDEVKYGNENKRNEDN